MSIIANVENLYWSLSGNILVISVVFGLIIINRHWIKNNSHITYREPFYNITWVIYSLLFKMVSAGVLSLKQNLDVVLGMEKRNF